MALAAAERIDLVNIGLMLISCAVAFLVPFELFLFSYAILGPLHYLTEISWLHDRNYFIKGRNDAWILVGIGALLTLTYFSGGLELEFPRRFDANVLYMGFFSALVLVTVHNKFYKIAGIVLVVLTSQLSQNFFLFFTVFLPTLLHVYVFTGMFMLYGALKNKSKIGIVAVVVLLLCPVLLYILFPNTSFHIAEGYSKQAMGSLRFLNIHYLMKVNSYPPQVSEAAWDKIIFHSPSGILAARFIAFAYTYHYLNWFSKTSIIQWHKVPRMRFLAVALLWIGGVAIYIYDYTSGIQWLFFLSFLHVLLELPLNFTSAIGIGKHLQGKVWKPAVQKAG